MYQQNVGREVSVTLLTTGEKVEGWVYAETPLALHMALDSEGHNIRYLPYGAWKLVSYGDAEPSPSAATRKTEAKSIDALEELLDTSFYQALDKIDQNRVRRIGKELTESHRELSIAEERGYAQQAQLVHVLHAVETHRELLDELTQSGLDTQLMTHQEAIRQSISFASIPQVDGYLCTLDQDQLIQLIQLAIEQDILSETNLGRSYLDKISAADILELAEELRDVEQQPEKRDETQSKMAQRLRKVAAGLKIAGGGGLAAANLAIGGLAGVVTALPTLGVGAVSAGVGIVTSMYTGFNVASAGLKDLADAIEGPQETDS